MRHSKGPPFPGVQSRPVTGSANGNKGPSQPARSAAPPVYRPGPVQMKPAPRQAGSTFHKNSTPIHGAPPVYRPFAVASQLKPAAAPPVYCPAPPLQQKAAAQLHPPSSAPPVYRPFTAATPPRPLQFNRAQGLAVQRQQTPGATIVSVQQPTVRRVTPGVPSPLPPPAFTVAPLMTAQRPPAVAAVAFASSVAQPAEWCSGIWDKITSCCRPRRNQRQQIELESENDESIGLTTETEVTGPQSEWVKEGLNVLNQHYPLTVHGGYISSCALVMFCGDDTFDCYHAKGGAFNSSHGMRSDPDRIYYVYMATDYDKEEYIANYRAEALKFQKSGGGAPIEFLAQTGMNGNVMVTMNSMKSIEPVIGKLLKK